MTIKKIIVTGALGHIGSYLIRQLPASFPGSTIILLDNLSSQRYCSLFNLPKGAHFEFIECDILSADLPGIFKDADVVIHLAAITDAANSFFNSDEVERVNYLGTQKVADACCINSVPLIFPSTASVYGTQHESVSEFCTPDEINPQSPYAESKLKSEQYIQKLGSTKNLRFCICRFGTIFGTSIGMRFHTAVNKFCWQAVTDQPITVWKTALHQKRPYLYLDDAARAVIHIINNGIFYNDIYNILTSNSTVSEIIEILRKRIPSASIQLTDSQIMNALSYTVSNERFVQTGFVYRGSFKEGIEETLDLLGSISNWEYGVRSQK